MSSTGLTAAGINSSVCFFPDRVTTGKNQFVPCDPTVAQSACCSNGESCVGRGLCYSDNGGIYRGGCTDKSWQDPACPVLCTSSTAGAQFGTQNSYQFLSSCENGDFVCGTNLTVCTAQPSYLLNNLQPGKIRQVNITGLTANPYNISFTPTTSSAASSGSGTSSSDPQPIQAKSSSGHEVAVGVGVAVPLGVLLILAIVWALWERRKRRKMELAGPIELSGTGMGATSSDKKIAGEQQHIYGGEMSGRPQPQELQ